MKICDLCFSSILKTQPGLLSADTWTLVASILRNLLVTWLVFLPVLTLFLLLPRLWTSILLRSFLHAQYSIPISLVVGGFAGMWALTDIGRSLPSANAYDVTPNADHYKGGQGKFILRSLVWLVISAAALSILKQESIDSFRQKYAASPNEYFVHETLHRHGSAAPVLDQTSNMPG